MYLPKSFSELDREPILELVEDHGFGTLLSWTGGEPIVSHIPFLVERGATGPDWLLGHVARANRHWELFDGKAPVLAIFSGPHGYISPSWYETERAVPTWNYAVVHVHGRPELLDAAGTHSIVDRLVEKHERTRANRWSGALPLDFVAGLLRGIVGFRIAIDRVEASFKLSQNRSPADREGTLAGLEREPDPASRELAAFARRYYARKTRP